MFIYFDAGSHSVACFICIVFMLCWTFNSDVMFPLTGGAESSDANGKLASIYTGSLAQLLIVLISLWAQNICLYSVLTFRQLAF